jgi:cell division protein FtsL
MGRLFNLVLLAAMIFGAAVTYDMKHKAEIAADRVASLQSDISREKSRITLLKAEWSMLTQPGRLQATVEKYADHFQLQPFSPDQIATIDEIPLRPIGIDAKDAEALARIAAAAPVALR